MKMRKHKRLRQEWAGRDVFLEHSDGRKYCWMVCGWRAFESLVKPQQGWRRGWL